MKKSYPREAFQKGEQSDRRQWREQGGERVAAVGKMQVRFAGRRICRAPQQGKAQDGLGQAANLGRAEPRHPQIPKQQSLQPKQIPELEA